MAKNHRTADQAQSVRTDTGLTRVRSLLSHPLFLPLVGAIFVVGQLADLLGTYVAQPHLEHEGNWLVMGLKSMGVHVGFQSAIIAKSVICALGIACLEFFAQKCRKYYPQRRLTGSAFVHYFIYGRTPDEPKGDPKSSRDVRALLVLFAGFWALSGPLYMYMGYDNLAAHYGWLRAPGFFIGGVYSTWADVFLMLTTLGGLLFLLEGDHHAVMNAAGRRSAGYGGKRLAANNRP
jgi:hypothetical protein